MSGICLTQQPGKKRVSFTMHGLSNAKLEVKVTRCTGLSKANPTPHVPSTNSSFKCTEVEQRLIISFIGLFWGNWKSVQLLKVFNPSLIQSIHISFIINKYVCERSPVVNVKSGNVLALKIKPGWKSEGFLRL